MENKPCLVMQAINVLRMCCYSGFNPGKKIQNPENAMMIYFAGLTGTGIMFIDMLENYRRFCVNKGLRLVIACKKETMEVFRYAGFQNDIIFEELDAARAVVDYSYFLNRIRALNTYQPEFLIQVCAAYAPEDVILHAISSGRKICVRGSNIDFEDLLLYKYFVNNTYDEIIHTDETEDKLTHFGKPLKELFLPDYLSKVSELPEADPVFQLQKKNYILICPGASTPRKRWPAERYLEVVKYLLDHYSFNIVICGVGSDADAAEKIEKGANNERIVNLVSRTSLKEWFSLISNAKLVLANESGAVHAAAAYKTPCVCIGAQEFGDEFLPYRPEFVRKTDCLPVIERGAKMPCYSCKGKRHYKNGGIRPCYAETGVFPCVDAVQAEQVIKSLNKLLER